MASFFNVNGTSCSCSRPSCDGCPTYETHENNLLTMKMPTVSSRRCVFCGSLENRLANTVSKEIWICLDCARQIGRLIGRNTES